MMLVMTGPETRSTSLERLERETFDLCVIGGGITGAGIALDAASRGLTVALVEKSDFASGTSSKSSKMVHGGLRYLAQYDLSLTWEASRERDRLRRLAPHLVRPLRFLFPAFRKGIQTRFATVGLTVYDLVAAGGGFERHHRADAEDIRRYAPSLDPSRVVGAWTYWDAATDDARLVFAVLRTTLGLGAAIANHLKVLSLDSASGRLAAATAVDELTGRQFTIRARSFVNAGGVWADQIARLESGAEPPALRPAKGIHLVVRPPTVPVSCGVVLPSIARDGRSIFAVPWEGAVVLGTTDTEFSGSLEQPTVTGDDLDYILSSVNWSLGLDVKPADVVSAWAGLRPLRADGGGPETRTADLSRKHHLSRSKAGLISITGGKLTTYRRMAADAVDMVCSQLGIRARSTTKRVPIGLSRPLKAVIEETMNAATRLGVDPDVAQQLVGTYGDRAPMVLALATAEAGLTEPLVPGLPWCAAQAVFAARHEMAVTLGDVLERRTRLSLVDPDAGLTSAAPALVAKELGWSADRLDREIEAVRAKVTEERGPAVPARGPARSGSSGFSGVAPEIVGRNDAGGRNPPPAG
jgi:glycerol-3-phosphate dehydrogenase